MSGDVRLVASVAVLVALVCLAGLATLHTRHYSQRRLILLEGEVETIKKLLKEDRTL